MKNGDTPRIDKKYTNFELKLARSKIHRWGVYAAEPIPAGRKVIEYTGEKISRREAKRRAQSRDLIYLFTLDSYWSIDGSVGGSGAEYINHSCEPNCEAVITGRRIFIHALHGIHPGTELAYDYQYERTGKNDAELERFYVCKCGAPNCRGSIMKPAKKKSR